MFRNIFLVIFPLLFGYVLACSVRQAEYGWICVCNSSYCDTVPPLGEIAAQNLKIYYTSGSDPGFNVKESTFTNVKNSDVFGIKVNGDATFQKILGFGGAFTDAASINIKKLSFEAQQKLLESYFGDDGIEYNICRVNLGSCDFSPRHYTLDDHDDDFTLEHFELQPEDTDFKIPVINQAFTIRGNKQLYLFASAWTAPLWMKDQYVWSGGSQLRSENFQLYANYTVKFFDEYLKRGVKFWGMTTANEPLTGYYKGDGIPCMGWTITGQVNWVADYLGPSLQKSQHKGLKIMIHDDNTITLPLVAPVFLANEKALEMVDGIATHWYWNGPDMMFDLFKTDKKELFILSSEACHFKTEPQLGKWDFAGDYLANIFKDLKLGYVGYVEWNLALNITGGPTHINVPADAPIIISEDSSEFYKQPTFYALGHFSKFVVPESVRIDVSTTSVNNLQLSVLAFSRPDNLKVVTIFNNNWDPVDVQIEDSDRFSDVITTSAKSITTVIYNV